MNQATHEYKEAIKVGYNLRRKVLLYVVQGSRRCRCLWIRPFGLLPTAVDYVHNVAMIWLVVGIGGLLSARCTFFPPGVQTGLVWMLKILTDPFHDLKLYWKAPLALARGELIDTTLATAVAESSPAGSAA